MKYLIKAQYLPLIKLPLIKILKITLAILCFLRHSALMLVIFKQDVEETCRDPFQPTLVLVLA